MQTTSFCVAFFPPSIEEVRTYFKQRGLPASEAECFFFFYGFKSWKNKKGKYSKNWKQSAYNWINSLMKHEPWRFNSKRVTA